MLGARGNRRKQRHRRRPLRGEVVHAEIRAIHANLVCLHGKLQPLLEGLLGIRPTLAGELVMSEAKESEFLHVTMIDDVSTNRWWLCGPFNFLAQVENYRPVINFSDSRHYR